jgi:DNA processing protein
VSDRKYWLGFSLVPEIGPKRLAALYTYFQDLALAWCASAADLRAAGLDQKPLDNLLRIRKTINLDAELDKIAQAGGWLLILTDDSYPPLLRKSPDAPMLLYGRGSLTPQDDFALAVVGTRRATTYGKDAAYYFARHLAAEGISIISGLAHGIDTAAHRGALESGGRTLAVLGCGIDRIYPPDNHKLAAEIMENGALLSEFPVGTPPEAHNFPRRNRIISGLALGVLVAEAPEKSGALITASTAGDQGREVFAVPGNIFSASSAGANRLIQDGAKLVITVEDVLAELRISRQAIITRTAAEAIMPENETEALILRFLSADPIHVDELVRLCGLAVASVSSTLTILELKGVARMVGPMQYSLNTTPI